MDRATLQHRLQEAEELAQRARKLLTKLQKVPNATPFKLLAEFKRLVAAEEASIKPKH